MLSPESVPTASLLTASAIRLLSQDEAVFREELRSLIEQGAVQDFDTGIWCLMNSDYYDKDEGIGFEPKDYII